MYTCTLSHLLPNISKPSQQTNAQLVLLSWSTTSSPHLYQHFDNMPLLLSTGIKRPHHLYSSCYPLLVCVSTFTVICVSRCVLPAGVRVLVHMLVCLGVKCSQQPSLSKWVQQYNIRFCVVCIIGCSRRSKCVFRNPNTSVECCGRQCKLIKRDLAHVADSLKHILHRSCRYLPSCSLVNDFKPEEQPTLHAL